MSAKGTFKRTDLSERTDEGQSISTVRHKAGPIVLDAERNLSLSYTLALREVVSRGGEGVT